MKRRSSSRLKVRALPRTLTLEQLEHRQMLSGDMPPSSLASVWSGDFLASGEASHAAPPTLSARSTAASAGAALTSSAGTASGAIDWIVQFKVSAAANITSAAQVVALLPQGSAGFQVVEGLGAVGEMLVRSQGATVALR